MKRSFRMISQILIVLSDTEEILNSDSDEENKLLYLTKIGYSEVEASISMERCGLNSPITELTNFIYAAQMVKATDVLLLITQRILPEDTIESPYFYYENVALAPINFWTEISQYLFDVEPKFVDSKNFYATALKQGYIHNLPIENKFPLILLTHCTIHDAFSIDNKLVTFLGSKNKVELFTNMYMKCQIDKKELNKDTPLEPDEVEMLLEVDFYCLGIYLKTDVQELNDDRLE
ncbi:hypothetical protein F3Y22_tig00116964pilonHSYRG00511 [Hibiscus syriacus]|uniref:SAM-dependent MTase DRM-type domain-containing protein n=1 Tax=Hibiscus syriacus TaxID=106335 RepID=A0A6A2XXT3_HIBSY|nr:hypothetical protein F3Y22_tig00116964pilonHSYRG00511 [Hibiscus syriacus]